MTDIEWKFSKFSFAYPGDMVDVRKAELGITVPYLSFIKKLGNDLWSRMQLMIIAESDNGRLHRQIRSNVIRGVNETMAVKIITKVNISLDMYGFVLERDRRDTIAGKDVVIYKRRFHDPRRGTNDPRTPSPASDPYDDITVVQPIRPRNREGSFETAR